MIRGSCSLDELRVRLGEELGVSDWIVVDQARIDAFAEITEDHQFIHVDLERAKQTPFGGTIAHGYLVLSLLSAMSLSGAPSIDGASMAINYGFDKVRFLTPVPAGSRVRGRFSLTNLESKGAGRWLIHFGVKIEVEGNDRAAAIADWLTLVLT